MCFLRVALPSRSPRPGVEGGGREHQEGERPASGRPKHPHPPQVRGEGRPGGEGHHPAPGDRSAPATPPLYQGSDHRVCGRRESSDYWLGCLAPSWKGTWFNPHCQQPNVIHYAAFMLIVDCSQFELTQ